MWTDILLSASGDFQSYGTCGSFWIDGVVIFLLVIIVVFVIIIGAFKVDASNWTPFVPNGYKSVLTEATVVFFAYIGFDAIANSAEESKRPQWDILLGIILYVGFCLVITGMVPYQLLGEDAPSAEAFKSKGLKYASVLISIGAVAGLTTTLLVGLYVQSLNCILGLEGMVYYHQYLLKYI